MPLLDQGIENVLGRVNKEYLIPSPVTIIKSIFGFVLLLTLSFVAGHPRVTQIERRLGIAHLATTGLPFVLLGLIASQPRVGVLSPLALMEAAPLLTLGLGWIGFGIGYRFDAQLIAGLPPGAGSVAWLMTVIPFLTVSVSAGLLMMAWGSGVLDSDLLRDAAMLGIAGAMTAKSSPFVWKMSGLDETDLDRMGRIVQLERIVGVVGLMLVTAYFRTEGSGVTWQLPATAWLFITLGMGVMVGGAVYAILSTSRSQSESLVLLLGSISFAAGMAHYLRLSAISVCFLVGVTLANAPGPWKVMVESVVGRLERPIYFLFLLRGRALASWRLARLGLDDSVRGRAPSRQVGGHGVAAIRGRLRHGRQGREMA